MQYKSTTDIMHRGKWNMPLTRANRVRAKTSIEIKTQHAVHRLGSRPVDKKQQVKKVRLIVALHYTTG
jgi:hypothetical protein